MSCPSASPPPSIAEADLIAPALRSFFAIADAWSLTGEEQQGIIAASSTAALECWRSGRYDGFGSEQLIRVSYVLGIYAAINTLLPQRASADAWMRKPNSNPRFRSGTPAECIATRDLAKLRDLRRYLDAELS